MIQGLTLAKGKADSTELMGAPYAVPCEHTADTKESRRKKEKDKK